MKRTVQLAALAWLLSIFNLQTSTAFAQGTLTPPGAPGATMLTLSQIQPRTPISSVPITITQAGSYYLTTNLVCAVSNAITIAVSGVSLDLNGFTISSTVPNAANGGTAILFNGTLSDITICNGHIRGGVTNNGAGVYGGSGFGYGIFYSSFPPVNVLVSHVSVSGCLDFGIFLQRGDSTVVESCTVRTVGSSGITASTIKQSMAMDCGGSGIYGDQISDCHGECSGSNYGIYAASGAQNCYGSSASYIGISAQNAVNCYGYNNGSSGSDGLYAGNCAMNCFGFSIGGYGISTLTAVNCYGETFGPGYGISTGTAQNCYGYCNGSGVGLYGSFVANDCYGYSYSGIGVSAFIANVCHGATTTGTALSTTHNVNSY